MNVQLSTSYSDGEERPPQRFGITAINKQRKSVSGCSLDIEAKLKKMNQQRNAEWRFLWRYCWWMVSPRSGFFSAFFLEIFSKVQSNMFDDMMLVTSWWFFCDLMWSISSNIGQICWLIMESSWIILGTRWAAPKIPIGGFYASCTIYITYLYLGIIMTHYRKPLWTSWYTNKAITKVALAIFSDYVPEPPGFIIFIDGNQ